MSSSYARDRFDQHLSKLARQEVKTNPEFSAVMKLLRSFLTQTEMAMREEDIEPEAIARVLDKLIWGMVSPGDLMRVEQARVSFSDEYADLSGSAHPAHYDFPTATSLKEPLHDTSPGTR